MLVAAAAFAVIAGGTATAQAKGPGQDVVDRQLAKARIVEDSLQQQAQEQTTTQTASTAGSATQTATTEQTIEQKQRLDCVTHCVGGTLTQEAVQVSTTDQDLAQEQRDGTTQILSGTQEASTKQRITQQQFGCHAWCWDTTLVQSATQLDETTQSLTQVQSGGSEQTADATQTATTTQTVKQVQVDCQALCFGTSATQTADQRSTGDAVVVQQQQGADGAIQSQDAVVSDTATQSIDGTQRGGDTQAQVGTATAGGVTAITQLQEATGAATQEQDAASTTAIAQDIAQEQVGDASAQRQNGTATATTGQAIDQLATQSGTPTADDSATANADAANVRIVEQGVEQAQSTDAASATQEQFAGLYDDGAQTATSTAGTDAWYGTSATTVDAAASVANVSAVAQDVEQTQAATGAYADQAQRTATLEYLGQTATAGAYAVQRLAENSESGATGDAIDQTITAAADASAANLATTAQTTAQRQDGAGSGSQLQDATQVDTGTQTASATPFALQEQPTNGIAGEAPDGIGTITQRTAVRSTGEAVNTIGGLQDATQDQADGGTQIQDVTQTAGTRQDAATGAVAAQTAAENFVELLGAAGDAAAGTITQGNVVETTATSANAAQVAQGADQRQTGGDLQGQDAAQRTTGDAVATADATALQDETGGSGPANVAILLGDGATATAAQFNATTATATASSDTGVAQTGGQAQDGPGSQLTQQDAEWRTGASATPAAIQVFPLNASVQVAPTSGSTAGAQTNVASTDADATVSTGLTQTGAQSQADGGDQVTEQRTSLDAWSAASPRTAQATPTNVAVQDTETGTNVAGPQRNDSTAHGAATTDAASGQSVRQSGGDALATQQATTTGTATTDTFSGHSLPTNSSAQDAPAGTNVGGEQVNRNGALADATATTTDLQDARQAGAAADVTQRAAGGATATATATAQQEHDSVANLQFQTTAGGRNVAGDQTDVNAAVSSAAGDATTTQRTRQAGSDARATQDATTTGTGAATSNATSFGIVNQVDQRADTGTSVGGGQTIAVAGSSRAGGTATTTQDATQTRTARDRQRIDQSATTSGTATGATSVTQFFPVNQTDQTGADTRGGSAAIVAAPDADAEATASTRQRTRQSSADATATRSDTTTAEATRAAWSDIQSDQLVATTDTRPVLRLVGLGTTDPVKRRQDADSVKRALADLDATRSVDATRSAGR